MEQSPVLGSEGSPTLEEKTPEAKKLPPGRPPFQLCFRVAKVRGRSDISPSHPRNFVHGVTGKFYSVREVCEQEPDVEAVNRAYNTGPRQRHDSPHLESHCCGWYHDVTFSDVEILNDRRLNFHKRTAPLFRIPTTVSMK